MLLIVVVKYKDWEKTNVAEDWSGSGPRRYLDLKEDNRVMDNTYGELECPLCNMPNMAMVGQFTTKGDLGPHMRCQRCWADSIWVNGEAVAWRSKEERLDRDNQPIL